MQTIVVSGCLGIILRVVLFCDLTFCVGGIAALLLLSWRGVWRTSCIDYTRYHLVEYIFTDGARYKIYIDIILTI